MRAPRRSSAAPPVRLQVILVAFVSSLIDQQYVASVIYVKALHAVAFDRWLAKRRVVLADLGDMHIERYQRRSRRPTPSAFAPRPGVASATT